jgi:molecular chaperone DnaK
MDGTSFGIDFGTTHTRVAYFDGKKLRMVPIFDEDEGTLYQIKTLVGYANKRPVAFGNRAWKQTSWSLPPGSIKWLLDRDDPVEIDSVAMHAVDIVADFFRYLREMVEKTIRAEPLTKTAISIPVHYPPRARRNLQQACQRAGIEITHFFFEPVAALYCDLVAHPASGVSAVFDWGGGSLDIATVRIQDGVAITRRTDGWHRGGDDFDRLISEQALQSLLRENPHIPFTADEILQRTNKGRQLQMRAEACKIELSRKSSAAFSYPALIQNINLNCSLTAAEFADWINNDVTKAIKLLERAIRDTGVTASLLSRLFLSGGTCNIPIIQQRLERELAGGRIVSRISLPPALQQHPGGLDDIGNATALGTALLAVHGTYPIFAKDVGVRLANASSTQERFYPVFRAGERVAFGKRKESFFVSDASSGVARLLVCDRNNADLQPEGRLLRLIAIPIDRKETWIDVTFSIDRHLVLQVEATGRIAKSERQEPVWIQQLDLGFKMPESDQR